MVLAQPLAQLASDLACDSPFKLKVVFGDGHIITVSVSTINNAVMAYVQMHYRRMGMRKPRGNLQKFHDDMIADGYTVSATHPYCVYKFTLCTCCDESVRKSKILSKFAITALHLDGDYLQMEDAMYELGFATPNDTILIAPAPCAVSLSK